MTFSVLLDRDRTNILFICGDNTHVNPAIGNELEVGFIGCASHRFNLAMNDLLADYAPLLNKCNPPMLYLRQLKPVSNIQIEFVYTNCYAGIKVERTYSIGCNTKIRTKMVGNIPNDCSFLRN
jgi:hypothetical protein